MSEGEHSWPNFAMDVTSKINRLTLDVLLRNICCQLHTTVDFAAAMNEGQIVLIKLPRGRLAEFDMRRLGVLIIGRVFGAVLTRGDSPGPERRPFHVSIDEFQNFVTATVGRMMAEARKYGLCLTLAN